MLQFRLEACRLYIARYSKRSPTMRLNFVWPASRSSCTTTQWHDCYYVIMSGSSHCKHTGSYVVMLLVWTRFSGLLVFDLGSIACPFSISYLPKPGLVSWPRKRVYASSKEITWLEWSQGIYLFLVTNHHPKKINLMIIQLVEERTWSPHLHINELCPQIYFAMLISFKFSIVSITIRPLSFSRKYSISICNTDNFTNVRQKYLSTDKISSLEEINHKILIKGI